MSDGLDQRARRPRGNGRSGPLTAAEVRTLARSRLIESRLTPNAIYDDEVWVSHLSTDGYRNLLDSWPGRRFRIRLGTALWHGDKRTLHLGADVLDVRPVRAGEHAGYRQQRVPCRRSPRDDRCRHRPRGDPLPDGRSPFHFARQRLALLEPPHMHTSMVLVPAGSSGPERATSSTCSAR